MKDPRYESTEPDPSVKETDLGTKLALYFAPSIVGFILLFISISGNNDDLIVFALIVPPILGLCSAIWLTMQSTSKHRYPGNFIGWLFIWTLSQAFTLSLTFFVGCIASVSVFGLY